MLKKLKPYQNLSLQDIEGEEWRDIEDFEGYYMVSNMGRVKSLKRKVWIASRGYYHNVKERILKQKISKQSPPPTVILKSIDLEFHKDITISHLVANAFLIKEKEKNYVFHRDLNILNNEVLNLFWDTEEYFSEIQKQQKDKKKNIRAKFGNSYCNYKGITEVHYFVMQIYSKKNNLAVIETFKTELEAAHKYDYYIKKYNLKRKGNFI